MLRSISPSVCQLFAGWWEHVGLKGFPHWQMHPGNLLLLFLSGLHLRLTDRQHKLRPFTELRKITGRKNLDVSLTLCAFIDTGFGCCCLYFVIFSTKYVILSLVCLSTVMTSAEWLQKSIWASSTLRASLLTRHCGENTLLDI